MKKNQKPHILFLLHLPPPIHGSSLVGQAIYKSKLFQETFNCTFLNLLSSSNIKETGKLTLRKVFGFVSTWFNLLFELLNKRPKICYYALSSTGVAFYKDVLNILLLKLFRVKCIYHMHNKGIKIFQTKKFNYTLYKFVFNRSEVILLSKLLYEDLSEFVSPHNIHICPNGIENMVGSVNQRDNVIPQILFLSNLIETKGVIVLLDACKVLLDKGVKFTCSFVGGEGDITSEIFEKLTQERGLNTIVTYGGMKFGKEKEKAFQEADIFVFPTYYSKECFPLVILEAMQASLPIITTYEGGIPDMVENGRNGFLVPQKDIISLANQIKNLIENKKLRTDFGTEGRKIFEKGYTLNIFESRLMNIILKSS